MSSGVNIWNLVIKILKALQEPIPSATNGSQLGQTVVLHHNTSILRETFNKESILELQKKLFSKEP